MKTKSMFKMSIKKVWNSLKYSKSIFVVLIFSFILGIVTTKNLVRGQNTFTVVQLENQKTVSLDTPILIDSPIEIKDSVLELKHMLIKRQLIAEVDNYISAKTRNKAHSNLAEYIVENALKHNIDVCFMMSQTEIETCYGTAGAGRPTSRRSLFGVIKKKYTNYNDAIDDYCKLLNKSYLTKGRREKDLMKNYVSSGGYRYAGSTTYEQKLTNVYNRISKNTSISKLQSEYKNAYNIYLVQLNETESSDSTVIIS